MATRRRLRPIGVEIKVQFIEEDGRGTVCGVHPHPPIVLFEAEMGKAINAAYLKNLTVKYVASLQEAGHLPKD